MQRYEMTLDEIESMVEDETPGLWDELLEELGGLITRPGLKWYGYAPGGRFTKWVAEDAGRPVLALTAPKYVDGRWTVDDEPEFDPGPPSWDPR